jgi:hypothetical protein
VVPGRRSLPHNLIGFVDLETRQLQVLDDSVGEHLPGIVGHVLLEQPAQEITLREATKPIEKAS